MNISAITDKPAADQSALAIRNHITQVESALAEFEKVSAGLADLAERYPPDLVYEVSTTKGMAEAIAHRAAWRDPRILVEKFRKTAKAPVLALGKDIDARASWLTEQLLVGETPIDEQIKVEERRKEEAKQAKIAAEFGRVQAIQEAIADLHMEAMTVNGKPSTVIAERLAAMQAKVLDPLVFQENMEQAKQALAMVVLKLDQMLKAQLFTEAEAAKLATERAELEQLRAAQAEQKRKDEAAAAKARKAEDARIAAERAAAQAEQRRLDAEAAAARAEADRVAKERRDAEQMRIDEERAELRRQQDAADAERRAVMLKAEANQKRLRDAAPVMLAALRDIRALTSDAKIVQIVDEAMNAAVES